MKALYDTEQSWEKAAWWKLDNGFTAVISYSMHYGEFISQFHFAGKLVWQACNGQKDTLPAFARNWRNSKGYGLVRPMFEKTWPT